MQGQIQGRNDTVYPPPAAPPADAQQLPALDVAGVLVCEGSSPTAHFFSHSLLETGNGETQRSVQMARRDVSCSERMAEVKLVMNDAQVQYSSMLLHATNRASQLPARRYVVDINRLESDQTMHESKSSQGQPYKAAL
jgi:hypothetical protein